MCVQVKESQQVKLVFSEQLSKLQTKQHQDIELLEEIRYCARCGYLYETLSLDSVRQRVMGTDMERECMLNHMG